MNMRLSDLIQKKVWIFLQSNNSALLISWNMYFFFLIRDLYRLLLHSITIILCFHEFLQSCLCTFADLCIHHQTIIALDKYNFV